MRARVLAVFVAVVAIQAAGCSRLFRCCGDSRDSRIPPAALDDRPLPPPASVSGTGLPAASAKPTGAYGGSGGE